MYYFENQSIACDDVVNRDLYPIGEAGSEKRKRAVEQVRRDLAEDGCAVLRQFFSSAGLEALLNEVVARKEQAYYSPKKKCNVYLGDGDPDRPADHPQNIFIDRTNGFVTADLFGTETTSRRFYYWAPLKDFLAECLGKSELYIYEDPISNMIVNVGRPGQEFNWHFDTNEFTITMLLQEAESGGCFEYVPNLRTPTDECYGEVERVLRGDRSRIRQLPLNAGDLQIFLGRFSLHRVTENTGPADRLLLIMSFAEKPGMVGSMYRVKDLYGKVTEEHHRNERSKVRADELLD